MKINIYLFLIIVFAVPCSGQYKMIKKSLFTDTTMYSIRNTNLAPQKGYFFTIEEKDTIYTDGYQVFSDIILNELRELYTEKEQAWAVNLETPINCTNDTTFLQINILTRNIDSLSIYLHSAKNQRWYKHTIKDIDDGYRISWFLYLSYFELVPGNERDSIISTNKFTDKNTNNILDRFILVSHSKDNNNEITIGSFDFFNATIHEEKYYHPIFDNILGVHSLDSISNRTLDPISGTPIVLQTLRHSSKPDWGRFYIVPDENKYDTIALLKKTVRKLLFHYPFYNEKSINKEDLLVKLEKLFATSISYSQLKEEVADLINGLNDPHFHIPQERAPRRRNISPIMVYEIDSKIKIAAIFDDKMKKISLNDRVISINNKPIEEIVLEQESYYIGSESTKRQRTVSNLFNSPFYNKYDSLLIKVERNQDTILDYIKYGNYYIPSNFRPKNGEFKKIENNIGYYRLRTFDMNSWIKFYYHAPEIDASKGLIIDLRGNSGGDERSVLHILSTFIKEPVAIYHEYFPPYTEYKETVVVKPSKTFHFEVPVIVLINNHTLCAAESLAILLRKHAGAIIIGDSKSGGAYSGRNVLVYPDGFEIVFNSLAKIVFENDYSIEDIGIEPDIYVRFYEVEDLSPYNDKILKTGLKILQYL